MTEGIQAAVKGCNGKGTLELLGFNHFRLTKHHFATENEDRGHSLRMGGL